MRKEILSTVMRAGGVASMVSGSLHLAGSARAMVARGTGYLEMNRGPYLASIGFLLISSGLTAAWAAGGVREGARWARGATAIAAVQGFGLCAITGPGFFVHLGPLSVGPVIVFAAHAFFLWQVLSRRQ
ncbi:MAG TPA: hypothetical protein VND93_25475 [Myxococcales bacterium]|jgi:hypothetical protein|nr:hypothetical protein [Myxococcales bacterium]